MLHPTFLSHQFPR